MTTIEIVMRVGTRSTKTTQGEILSLVEKTIYDMCRDETRKSGTVVWSEEVVSTKMVKDNV
jgi:hypothetical protein